MNSQLPSSVATLEQPATSPSGAYVLKLMPGTETYEQGFGVYDQAGTLVASSEDVYDVRHTTFFLWGEADRVWVYSGDLGTYFYEMQDGKLTKSAYARSEVSAPDFLKQEKPRHHQR